MKRRRTEPGLSGQQFLEEYDKAKEELILNPYFWDHHAKEWETEFSEAQQKAAWFFFGEQP